MPAKPHNDDAMERGIGLTITASIETMALSLAGGGRDWIRPAQGCEGGLGTQPAWVVTGSDEQAGCPVCLKAEYVQQSRGSNRHQSFDLQFHRGDLQAEIEVSLRKQAESVFGDCRARRQRTWSERFAAIDQLRIPQARQTVP